MQESCCGLNNLEEAIQQWSKIFLMPQKHTPVPPLYLCIQQHHVSEGEVYKSRIKWLWFFLINISNLY